MFLFGHNLIEKQTKILKTFIMSDYEKSAFTLRYLIYYARIIKVDDRIFRIKQKTRKGKSKRFNALKSLNSIEKKVLQKKNFVNNMKIIYLYFIFKFLLYRHIFDYTDIYRTQQNYFYKN